MSLAAAAGRIVRTASAIVSRPPATLATATAACVPGQGSAWLTVPATSPAAAPPSHDAGFHSFGHGDGWGFQSIISREELERSEYLRDDCFAIQCDVDVTTLGWWQIRHHSTPFYKE
uniref:MATH domain-containing protein n=1 Tax=Oryza barthii TaxID=65489 RepID=A0A0D3HP60_9ORYZ